MLARHSLMVIGLFSSISYLALTGIQTGPSTNDSSPFTAGVNAAALASTLDQEDIESWDGETEVAAIVPAPAPTPLASPIEQQLFDLVNRDRAASGLDPVGFAPELLDIA